MVKQPQGFTLVELVIVVLIVGLLTLMAYPSYTNYVRAVNRTDMQRGLIEINQALERYHTQNLSYQPIAPVTAATFLNESYIYGTSVFPLGASGNKVVYNLSLSINNNGASYVLVATPIGAQATDGILVIDHRGRRCWSVKDSNCSASNNTDTGWK
jgi:type IV pilus assembly protein PilE